MVVLLSLLAVAMMLSGIASIVFGAPVVQVERGWTMVISGSVGASGGAVLLGVALAVQRLGAIANEMAVIRDRVGQMEEMAAMRTDVLPDDEAFDDVDAAPGQPLPDEPPPGATVVGQYASGGSSYVMYSDGSIRADLPGGPRRFASIGDLRAFVAAHGG